LRAPSKKQLAHLALLTVAIIYGINYSIAKDVMQGYVGPSGFILIRAIGATTLFWLLAGVLHREKLERKDFLRVALSGAFGVAINQLFFFNGLSLTSPISASVIMTTNPIMVLLLSAVALKVPLTWPRIAGIALGMSGALFLITRGGNLGALFTSDDALGNLFILFNALSYAAYLVTVKPLMAKYEALTVIKWVFLFGMLYVLPFGFNQFMAVDWGNMPGYIAWEIAFVVVCTTFLAYLLNIYALKTVTSTTVSFYIYLQPLVATTTALLLGLDELSTTLLISAALIFSGVYMVSFYKR
jgi:drug/metabolite transporter (DMT)-like permease